MSLTIALAGNPNCGKTTLFNALTGARHHVGNWPGVTVERRSGTFEQEGLTLEVVDLPGAYSLAARSEDERVAAKFLASPEVDLVLNVLDASNLERNLYLSTQLLELGKPVAFVLNMVDDAENRGVRIDLAALETLLGGPVIPTVGNREQGIPELKALLAAMARGEASRCRRITVDYGHDIEGELANLETEICRDERLEASMPPRWLALQLLENNADAKRLVTESHASEAIGQQLAKSFAFLEPHLGADGATLIAERRYGFAHGLVKEVASAADDRRTPTSRLDAVLTHRWLGIPIFVGILALVYSLSFILGKIPQDWIAEGFKALSDFAGARLPAGELTSLLVDGVIPGVSAVIVFVPVIMILMGCIAFLEDTGYMARAAFIMDRLMHVMGLHGKSFIPLIMGSGCNVPAVQAARTIESPQDRLITILVTPLVSCSARLQVYIVIAGTFFTPFKAALAIIGMHFLGLGLAVLMGRMLRSALFQRSQLTLRDGAAALPAAGPEGHGHPHVGEGVHLPHPRGHHHLRGRHADLVPLAVPRHRQPGMDGPVPGSAPGGAGPEASRRGDGGPSEGPPAGPREPHREHESGGAARSEGVAPPPTHSRSRSQAA